ncbi:MAG: SDR family NAD(P)-dependent oxidoreductase [Lactovum sp.]
MNDVALITGASSGIGAEFARIHASKKRDLVLVARRESRLNDLKEELIQKNNIEVKVIIKDLTERNAAQDIYDELKKEKIKITYLINNAGFGGQGYFHERTEDLKMIQLNILALTHLTRLFLPELLDEKRGGILNVSSIASLMAGPLQAVYYASKSYVRSFSNALAIELEETNVRVTCLLPGMTETEFAERSEMDKTKVFDHCVSAHQVAKIGYSAMEKGKLEVFAGLPLSQKILFKCLPFIPKKVLLRQVKRLQKVSKKSQTTK